MQFTSEGLAALRIAGVDFLARGDVQVSRAIFRPADGGAPFAAATIHKTSFDGRARRAQLAFDWGSITVAYYPGPSDLRLAITVRNTSRARLESLGMDAVALRFPRTPLEYDGVTPLLATNIGAPTVLSLRYGAGALVLCNEQVGRPLLAGFPWALDRPANREFPLRLSTGREPMYPDSLPSIDRPIGPGGEDHYQIALRWEPAGGGETLAPDVFHAFAAATPFHLHWPDRRPIGSLIIGTAAAGWSRNPRGWLLDAKLDTSTAAGAAEFRRRLLAWADRSIANLVRLHAQGMITWDVEGEEFRHPTTYIGDPRLAEALAPEMRGVIDEYFARFRRAGLRVGVTIRPQTAVTTASGSFVRQTPSADPARVLREKIDYARKRWGATLFYIDSNGDQVFPLSFDVLREVAEAEPDVLLIPEHKNTAYYSRSAPYTELRSGVSGTPAAVRAVYPGAFSVINTADGGVGQHYPELERAAAGGDILMFRAWFDDGTQDLIEKLARRAGSGERPRTAFDRKQLFRSERTERVSGK